MLAVTFVLYQALNLYWWIVIASAILSWLFAFNIVNPGNPFVDSIGRFGGEEFVIVLPEMDLEEAQETAERLRRKVAEEPQPLGNGEAVPLTISVGVAVYPDHGQTASTLCAAADKAMYLAKDRGRNCVAMAHLHDQVHNQ